MEKNGASDKKTHTYIQLSKSELYSIFESNPSLKFFCNQCNFVHNPLKSCIKKFQPKHQKKTISEILIIRKYETRDPGKVTPKRSDLNYLLNK
jgi:hypothetical protein